MPHCVLDSWTYGLVVKTIRCSRGSRDVASASVANLSRVTLF